MATPINQITSGLRAFGDAFGIIRRNKMGKYFVVPVIVNIILAGLLIWGGWGLGEWISSLWDSEHGGWLGWAKNGEPAGTAGASLRMEALQIQIVPKDSPFDRGGAAFYQKITIVGENV